MSSLPSDEVAGDYRDALDDLITNDRFQIANLTMIAKENIEHAEAISRTLTLHIKKAPPSRKLPALYVLDSLVKNIGSPYTVYFGRNLHETYMLAYSQVDQAVRRKLEEMLKTWREPVPGSLSSTPVFPLQSTQSIMDALNRYKASTAGRPPQAPIRAPSIVQTQAVNYRQPSTPTPPQPGLPYPPPQVHILNPTPTPPPQPYYQQPPQIPTPQYSVQSPQTHTPIQQFAPVLPPSYQTQNGYGRPGVDLGKLHADIDDLTTDAKIDCTTHPMDQSKLKKLETLQGLKAFLDNSASIGEHDLREVRDTITREMEKRNAEKLANQHISPTPTPQLPYGQHPQWQPPMPYQQPPSNTYTPQPTHNSYSQPQYPPVPTPQSFQGPPPPPPAFLNTTNLADLLRSATNAQNNATPPAQNAYTQGYSVPVSSTPALSHATSAPSGATLSLLDQIRASGILSKVGTPLQGTTPPITYAQPMLDEVPFTSASIKIPRPHLILKFINEKPNQCSTCGRRFTSDESGRAKKEKHLDWHFKTKARSLEAEQRGQNRSWYVDEMEWITSREYEDDLGLEDPSATTNGQSPAEGAKKKEQNFVRTPSDPAYRNATCPIDQEPFKSEWSEDVQDFIWRDAVKVGEKYYHASCYKEAMKAREAIQAVPRVGTPLAGFGHRRTATPDSVLGKRKAEDDEPMSVSKSRLKIEV